MRMSPKPGYGRKKSVGNAVAPGVVLAGASYTRAAGSDMSLVDPASDRDDSSAQYSDSVHGSITSDSEAEHVSYVVLLTQPQDAPALLAELQKSGLVIFKGMCYG